MNTKAIAILETLPSSLGTTVRSLGKGKTLALVPQGVTSVYCLAGVLWITRDGLGKDIIVKAGETSAIGGRGRIVISAFEDSRLWVA